MSEQGKILLVEDEEDLREMMKYQLESAGYHVTGVEDGTDALTELNTETPDLILLDLNLPKMGGVEFYEKVSVDEDFSVPIIVTTAREEVEGLFESFNVEAYLAKPFTMEQLLKTVKLTIR